MSGKSAISTENVAQRYGDVMMNTFGAPQLVLVRGEGSFVWDDTGKQYLDLLGGIAVNVLGHAHPKVNKAIAAQAGQLGHVSNFFATPPQVALAEKLAKMATPNDPGRPAKVFLANSGTEANEAAFKLARMTGRKRIIAMEGSFHGRTMGALAATFNPPYREPFEPLPGVVEFVPFGNVARLNRLVDDTVAAVVLEPIQGENGVIEAPAGYLAEARKITAKAGALLWLDEIQSGMGRTGTWLASEPSGVTADIVTFAKGLGNGFPIGACVATGPAADLFTPGTHGSTFGGNPLAAAAALATLGVIEAEGLLAHAAEMGAYISRRIEDLHMFEVARTRGRGLMLGIELRTPVAKALAQACLEAGVIVNAPRPDVVRILPALNITTEELDGFIDLLPKLFKAIR
ncbi:MAG: acetylornithine transaminase [Propionibacteriaceae bacterium]|jgi:acetylornithine aminotransferase|nr:acetylornithine transaminase [Propionibacteriaceae bacterium]